MTVDNRRLAREGLRNIDERRTRAASGCEIREAPNGTGGTVLTFTGYASVTGEPYEMEDWAGPYNEEVQSGAFAKTLAEGADVGFVLNHDAAPLARTKSGTLTLAEDTTGLNVEARLDPASPPVGYLRSAIERGDLDEMSFKFRVIRQSWSPDYDYRKIQEVSLNKGDVSVVNYGANPHTAGLIALRARVSQAGITFPQMAGAFKELRAGATFSKCSNRSSISSPPPMTRSTKPNWSCRT